jgi:DmsE family decaheme c-type cytochrome
MRRLHRRVTIAVCLALSLASLYAVLMSFSSIAQRLPVSDVAQMAPAARAGDAVCLQCHGRDGAYPVASIADTKHGVTADRRTPGCADCHGDSAAHARNPMSVRPARRFGGKAPAPVAERNHTCLACHQDSRMTHWVGSVHEADQVACTSCHDVHRARDRVLAKATQAGVCLTCHVRQRTQMRMPSRHPVLEGKVLCADCHDPHGAAGPALMARDTVNDTCFQCHAEKRGPFIWNHQPVTENCALCHEPHGTTVANMLKWRQPFLCQQCHEVTSHRGAIPSISVPGGTSGTGVTLARGCANCHTNIHGSNNPTNSAGSRSFRR